MSTNISSYSFSNIDILKLVIKDNEIHEGIWMFGVEFGMSATNTIDEITNNASPAAIVSLQSFRITRVSEVSPLAIDAAVINPKVTE